MGALWRNYSVRWIPCVPVQLHGKDSIQAVVEYVSIRETNDYFIVMCRVETSRTVGWLKHNMNNPLSSVCLCPSRIIRYTWKTNWILYVFIRTNIYYHKKEKILTPLTTQNTSESNQETWSAYEEGSLGLVILSKDF